VAVSEEPVDLSLDEPRNARSAWLYRLGAVALGLTLLGLWEILPRIGLVSDIVLPPFSEVASALSTLVQQGFFWSNLWTTLREILVGFVLGSLIGFVLGVALAVWSPFKRLVYPYVVAFQAVPKIVFAPLFIAWFGFDQTSKIVMAIVISFFPVLINTMIGLQSVPFDAVRLMRSLRATRLQTFWKVSLPHALPVISAGVKTALTFAVIGAIVAEFVGAAEGLGYLLDLYNFQLATDRVFAVIVVLSVIGAAGFFLLEWIDRKLIFWQTDDE
jgi:NitT/TauT family transport system permease protein